MISEKRAPRNTTKEVDENPVLGMVTAMGGGIQAQEVRGQQSFVGSDTLPTEISRYGDYDVQAVLEAASVKFHGVVEGDDMF